MSESLFPGANGGQLVTWLVGREEVVPVTLAKSTLGSFMMRRKPLPPSHPHLLPETTEHREKDTSFSMYSNTLSFYVNHLFI